MVRTVLGRHPFQIKFLKFLYSNSTPVFFRLEVKLLRDQNNVQVRQSINYFDLREAHGYYKSDKMFS